MTLFLTSSLTARSVRAFAPAILRQRSSPGILVRHMAADSTEKPPMPHPDDKMPYYALGVNLAMQVGGQGNIKTLLEEDEMELVLEGFCDNLRGTSTADARVILQTYGMELNKILQDRSSRITERVKKEGEEFIASFLDCNDEAEQKERYEHQQPTAGISNDHQFSQFTVDSSFGYPFIHHSHLLMFFLSPPQRPCLLPYEGR